MEDVEEEGDDPLGRRAGIDLGHGVLEGGRPLLEHPERLTVEHRLAQLEPAHRVDDSRQRGGRVVEVARVDAHLVAATVDLDPDPVELPLDRRALEALHGLGDAAGGGGEHREDRPEDLEADLAQALLTAREREPGGRREITREHQRAARQRPRDAGRLRDRVDHEPGEGALAELAGEEPLDEIRLRLRRAAEQVGEIFPAPHGRAGARHALNGGDRPIQVFDRDRRLLRGGALDPVDRRVADSHPALARHARQETDSRGHLVRFEPPQQVRQGRDLLGARARRGHVPRCGHDVGEQGHFG